MGLEIKGGASSELHYKNCRRPGVRCQSVRDTLHSLRDRDGKFRHGTGRVASVETNYPDTEEAKQALAILADLYANETDETMRRIAVDTSLSAICGTNPKTVLLIRQMVRSVSSGPIQRIRLTFTGSCTPP